MLADLSPSLETVTFPTTNLSTPMAAYISAAHGSPAEGSSGRGGRRRGSKNINEEDTARTYSAAAACVIVVCLVAIARGAQIYLTELLSLCLRFVPVSCRGWEEVTEEFNKWAESYGRPTRPRTSIKNKYVAAASHPCRGSVGTAPCICSGGALFVLVVRVNM